MLHWLHNFSLNTDCDLGDSQADPSFVSVALDDFNTVKSRSCVCSSLKTKFDPPEIYYVLVSGPTCRQTSIYLSTTDIAYRISR